GTSLSKGWKLIERFSEDIDLFLNPQMFNPSLSKNSKMSYFRLLSLKVMWGSS
ncbi:MAG: nucleotidyl transferase AbiEii/AbiGii toxin family protein, partial [Sphaerospermopsis kisseleviana]